MSQKQEDGSDATFNTLIFAAMIVGGAMAGAWTAARVVPESHIMVMIGVIMLPLGMVLGLSFAQGVGPPTAVLNMFAVFAGRTTVEQVIGRGGKSGGVMSLAVAITIGSVVVAMAMAGLADVFVKPEVPFTELAKWFGGVGLLYGVVSGGLLLLTME